MEVSGQPNGPAALPPRERAPRHIEEEVDLSPESFWTLWIEKDSVPLPGSELGSSSP